MLTKSTKRKFGALICALLVLTLLFCGCDIKEDVKTQRELSEKILSFVIDDDFNGAYALVRSVGTEADFTPVWDEMRTTLKDSMSYELKTNGWKSSVNNGTKLTQVSFEVTTDNGKTCYITVTTYDDGSIAGLHFLDSTDFIESTAYVPVVNAVLKVISLAFMAFTVWMFVDVLRRRMNRKVIWVLLTLIHAGISLVTGPSQFNIKFNFKIAIGLSGITAYNSSLAVATSVLLPVGAIIYFFVRKKLTAQFDAENQAETENGQHKNIAAKSKITPIRHLYLFILKITQSILIKSVRSVRTKARS
jgi:hypothetical protein